MKDLTNITHRSSKKVSTDITKNLKNQFQSKVTPVKLKHSVSNQNIKINQNSKQINSNYCGNLKNKNPKPHIYKDMQDRLELEYDHKTNELASNILENSNTSFKSCKSHASNRSNSRGD
jgi:ribonuclease HII